MAERMTIPSDCTTPETLAAFFCAHGLAITWDGIAQRWSVALETLRQIRMLQWEDGQYVWEYLPSTGYGVILGYRYILTKEILQ